MKHPNWTERYRPNKVADCILPERYKNKFQAFVDAKFIPDMTLAGPSGIGKTSVAMAMLDELKFDYIKINTSLKGIDELRSTILDFASSMSFGGSRKYVILDEADRMTQGFQEGLRGFMDEFSSNCGFILTCNYPEKIIPAIHSRCELIEIIIEKEDFRQLATEFYKKLCWILDEEKVEYNKTVIVELLKKVFPDFRKGIALIQSKSLEGPINVSILSSVRDKKYEELIEHLKVKNWDKTREWVGENFAYIGDFSTFAKQFYDSSCGLLTNNSLPIFVELWNRYDFQNAFVTDKEINLSAFLLEFMNNVTWK